MSWLAFAAVIVAFLATHSIPLRPSIKSRCVDWVGARGFMLGYSTLSLVMLCAVIYAAGQAPFVPLWDNAPWQKYATLLGMLVVCMLLALSIGRANPFSFGGARNDEFDPKHPGIVRLTRHPLLVALALWAGLHVLPNGDLAHVILFGLFTAFALLGFRIVDRRMRRILGDGKWRDMRRAVLASPLIQRPRSAASLCLRCALGGFVYVVLIAAHPAVLGVSPLP